MQAYVGIFPEGRVVSLERYAAGEGPEGMVKHGRFVVAGQEMVAMDSHVDHGITFNEALSLQLMCKDQGDVDRYCGQETGDADDQGEQESVEQVSVDPKRVSTERHREVGTVHVGYQMWQRLGLDTILAGIGLDERTRELSCARVLNRLSVLGARDAGVDSAHRAGGQLGHGLLVAGGRGALP
jgi:hypothetical protein